jgi:hypothetical protein
MITWQYAELALSYDDSDDLIPRASIAWSGPDGREDWPATSDLMELINQAGADGWELVSALYEQDISTNFPFGADGPGNTRSSSGARIFYFKRPIRSERE